jgi:hypothetical protein
MNIALYHGPAPWPRAVATSLSRRPSSPYARWAAALERKAFQNELASLRSDLEFLQIAVRLIRLRAECKAGFDPAQPRDEQGRWTDGALAMARLPRVMRPPRPASPRTTEDILKPNGNPVGQVYRGAGNEVRTVTKPQFDALKLELQNGAKPVAGPRGYRGQVYERSDGVQFDIRESQNSGQTIDIIRGNGTTIENQFKVHFQ